MTWRQATSPETDSLRAYEAFLRTTLVYARYLRATGHLAGPESATDLAMLAGEHERVCQVLTGLERPRASLPLPVDPVARLTLATRNQLRSYREAVVADACRLRARSAALVRRSREARRHRPAGANSIWAAPDPGIRR